MIHMKIREWVTFLFVVYISFSYSSSFMTQMLQTPDIGVTMPNEKLRTLEPL